jgi:hypothetical protein
MHDNEYFPTAGPGTQFPKPRYMVYDRTLRRWEQAEAETIAGGAEQNLFMDSSGDLWLSTTSGSRRAHVFPERFVVVPHLQNFTPSLN